MNKMKNLILLHINSIGCRAKTLDDKYKIGKCEGIIEAMYMLDYIDTFTCDVLRRACREIGNDKSLSSVTAHTQTIIDFCNKET